MWQLLEALSIAELQGETHPVSTIRCRDFQTPIFERVAIGSKSSIVNLQSKIIQDLFGSGSAG